MPLFQFYTKAIATLMFSVLLGFSGVAENPSKANRFQEIDHMALATPRKYTNSVKKLAAYLNERTNNDFEKARAYYSWIAENVAYDYARKGQKNRSLLNADQIIKRKKGVCSDYSILYMALCHDGGIKCEKISGITEAKRFRLKKEVETTHAWNVVLLGGKWYLIDVTWGARKDTKGREQVSIDYRYFCADPNFFVKKHLPANPVWQLMDNPYSYKSFKRGFNPKFNYQMAYLDSLARWDSLSFADAKEMQLILEKENLHRDWNYIEKKMVFAGYHIYKNGWKYKKKPTLDELYLAHDYLQRGYVLYLENDHRKAHRYAKGVKRDIEELERILKRAIKRESRNKKS